MTGPIGDPRRVGRRATSPGGGADLRPDGLGRLLAPLLHALEEAIAVLDRSGHLRFTNHAFREQLGYGDELIGSGAPFPHWPPERRADYSAILRRLQRRAGRDVIEHHEVELQDSAGIRRSFLATVVGVALDEPLLVVILHDAEDPRPRLRALERSMRRITAEVHRLGSPASYAPAVALADEIADRHGLSARQRTVLQLFAEHRDVHSMAEALHLSPHTVRNHLKATYRRLGVRSQQELRALLERPQ